MWFFKKWFGYQHKIFQNLKSINKNYFKKVSRILWNHLWIFRFKNYPFGFDPFNSSDLKICVTKAKFKRRTIFIKKNKKMFSSFVLLISLGIAKWWAPFPVFYIFHPVKHLLLFYLKTQCKYELVLLFKRLYILILLIIVNYICI